ncbi:hypothetical protein [Polynucleobacter sp. P1-05-14]|uniref:hypothetical protein n=1 Tax=Polynucleobacter sp. P1-05-14 TaxID=1819732 RepID=UPI001C0E4D58|nr:hypothetical protein [Polynucleobacter sp. P1-05-14]MBU3549486.1 hypothetical protein [Polynucleobacter sp. P1-05-14]
MGENKNARGSSAQFFVAGELCRRDLVAVVTMGNTPNTDILCSNTEGTKFVHIQVKTFVPGNKTVTVGQKAEKEFGKNFIWVLAGIPKADSDKAFEYYIIPSDELAKQVKSAHEKWMSTEGKNGQKHNETTMRTVHIPPATSITGWSIEKYKNKWEIIESLLK